jgi:hypothetical protein
MFRESIPHRVTLVAVRGVALPGGNNMKAKLTWFVIVLTVVTTSVAWSQDRFTLTADYTMPIGNEKIEASVGVGAEYRFWGIFVFSATMYTEIVYGADNIFNISQVRPIGLFSGGLGMKIPLGGFDLTFDWQKYFTGTSSAEGVFPFSDSYAIGAAIDLSNSFGVEIFSRRLYNFSEQAITDAALKIESAEDTVETIGVALQFHLF